MGPQLFALSRGAAALGEMPGAKGLSAVKTVMQYTAAAKKQVGSKKHEIIAADGRKIGTYYVESKWLIDRRSSRWMNYWTALMLSGLFFAACVTPFEVAFLTGFSDPSAWKEPRFLIARFIDLYFTLDLFFSL